MIRLKSLLKEGHAGRSKPISKEKFLKLYNSNASDFELLKDDHIYRGIRGFGYDFAMIDPSQHSERKSAYAGSNYYTLIINHSHEWRRYPKRELSCTTSTTKASGYGDVYLVIPFNGVEWAICPHKDIFFSFDKLQDVVEFDSVDRFVNFLKKFMDEYLGSVPNEESFQDLKNHLSRLGDRLDEVGFFEESYSDRVFKKGFKNFWKPYQNSFFFEYNELDEFVFDLLDPEENNFEKQDSWHGAPDNREVWTDGPCLLLNYLHFKENSVPS